MGIETPLALLLALALTRKLRGLALYRAAYFTPAVTSTIAVAVVWAWVFNPQYGIINQALEAVGITGPGWLVDPNWALPAIIIMSVWKNAGYHMVIFLAGLQDIPESYYEAASIDGASGWQKFWKVTWPLLIAHHRLCADDQRHLLLPGLWSGLRDDRRRPHARHHGGGLSTSTSAPSSSARWATPRPSPGCSS